MRTPRKSAEHPFPRLARTIVAMAAAAFLAAALPARAEMAREDLVRESQEAMEKADPFMGDWQGIYKKRNRTSPTLAAQVIALGKGRYHANILAEFDKGLSPIATLEGRLEDGEVRFFGWGDVSEYEGPDWQGVIANGTFRGTVPSRHGGTFVLRKVIRLSPTLGEQPPAGAVVLFDGTSLDEWQARRGRTSIQEKISDGFIEMTRIGTSISTRKRFTYFKLHVEFRTPFRPEAREQGRGNSGVFVHGREVQVLDCYGLKGRAKGGGGLYPRYDPILNMCAPPMQWQTYDIVVPPPKQGEMARLTVLHNGVMIHDGVELGRNLSPAVVQLQNHGNPVQYRNIWLVELP